MHSCKHSSTRGTVSGSYIGVEAKAFAVITTFNPTSYHGNFEKPAVFLQTLPGLGQKSGCTVGAAHRRPRKLCVLQVWTQTVDIALPPCTSDCVV